MSNRKLISDKYSKIILEYEKICSMTVNLTKFKSETIDWKNYIERLIPKGIKIYLLIILRLIYLLKIGMMQMKKSIY